MNKVRISFEVTDSWNREEFRQLIRIMMFSPITYCKNPDAQIELFIISNNDSSAYVYKIANQLGLNDGVHTILCNFRQDKVNACIANNIDIHFDSDSLTTVMLEPTLTNAILVRSITDPYHVTMKYVVEFEDVLKTIINEKFS
jgi:hypothetical protein